MILKELFVKLGLDVDEAAFAKGQLAAGLVEAALHKVVEVATEVAHAFKENVMEAIEYGDKIRKTSQSVGVAAEALQELQYAGKLADLSAEEMSQSLGLLSRRMMAAKDGSEEASKAFKGIKFMENGQLKPTEEVLGAIADKFHSMKDGPEKTALAMQLFGRAGKQMIPLLNEGSHHLEKLRQEARDFGLVLDNDVVVASEELNDNLHRLHMLTQGIWRQAIAPLIPEINKLVERFLAWRKENAKIIAQRLQWFIGLLVKGFHLLADVIDVVSAGLKYIHVFMPLIAAGVTGLTVAMIFLKREAIAAGVASLIAWGPVALLFVGIAAAVAALLLVMEDFAVFQRGGKSIFGKFLNTWDSWVKSDPSDGPIMRFVKELLQGLGTAQQIIDDIGYFFEGYEYFENKKRRKNPELFNEQGQYVGAQDKFIIPNTGGQQGTRRRGQMTINGEVVRKEGSLTGQLDSGRFAKTTPMGHGSGHGGNTNNVHAPANFNIFQQPGENGKALAEKVGEVMQRHIQGAIPPGGHRD